MTHQEWLSEREPVEPPADLLPASPPGRDRLADGWSVAAGVPLLAAAALHVVSLFLSQGHDAGTMSSEASLVVAEVIPAAGWLLAAVLAVPDRSRPAAAALGGGLALGEAGLVLSSVAGLGETPGPGLWMLAAAWVAGLVGAGVAWMGSPVWMGRPLRHRPPAPIGGLTALAALLMGALLLPAWDRYVVAVRALGQTRVYHLGSAFQSTLPSGSHVPAGAQAGDFLAAVAWVAVPIGAALWRPGRIGVLLSAGVLVAVAGQVASAVVGFDDPLALYSIFAPARAVQLGASVAGASLTGWYDAEVVAALALASLLLLRWWTADPPVPATVWHPPHLWLPHMRWPARPEHAVLADDEEAAPEEGAAQGAAPPAGDRPPGDTPAGDAPSVWAPADGER